MLYHTSPDEITTITNDGRFGSFLFFSGGEYVMGRHYATYAINEEVFNIIEASSIFYDEDCAKADPVVAEVMARFDLDEDTACNLLDESASVWDLDIGLEPEDLADASWDIQLYTARAAVAMGYDGVEVEDEQGTAYMIDMLGRESDLTREK